MAHFVGAIDQGTTSTRFMIFDRAGREIARHQIEHRQILPAAGWVEHDATEIWENTLKTISVALAEAGLTSGDLAAIGITNQRESVVAWDRTTGKPCHNVIVWQDTRTDALVSRLDAAFVRDRTGLPPATYFSATKIQWLLENVDGLRARAEAGDVLFGTIDSWLIWNLTGGQHLTDVTNASRTMLMDLESLQWDQQLLDLFGITRAMLPEIRPSAEIYGHFEGVPIAAAIGDQQAALFGQTCFAPGEAKCTYGTGGFLLMNTGSTPVRSSHGLITTVGYQFGSTVTYALEGSIAVAGAAIQWLRDQLGVLDSAAASETLAAEVEDSAGICFVPAFSGLFAPYWRPDARAAIVGLSRYHTAAHITRAALEAICYQTRDVVEAMAQDSGTTLDCLQVDGGVTGNALCMQLQADILGVPVSRPAVAETTALGAAYAAGLQVGFWHSVDDLRANWHEDRRWQPTWSLERREEGITRWKAAIDRTLGWVG
ncbi:putative glycerol kinase [Actinoplanes missouriensis 431]|uniref:Glycerol kinase n=1 Tax=Actinoplanes missouriensis (strain ATCC 14538 / DSM 43046 / CBS 188.64 / JCM 3121 / NBRC 102363 / NCIMB 12654 / NRRL B-3342 / UNCC 431) TaxID=512565 RepID=I0H0E5_ACTM4|nr:glycerol kinase GlpK [Actinoplanes missouriensis]BAL86482.1 putative glycerol kinase [Actinoplanes missouriensis 431]